MTLLPQSTIFKGFVTAIREHLQLESDVQMAPIPANARFTYSGIYHQQCGRRPKFVQKNGKPNYSCNSFRAPRSPGSFVRSPRKGICHRCKKKWTPDHRCQPGPIRNYARDSFKKEDATVHIVSDIVLGMERDLE